MRNKTTNQKKINQSGDNSLFSVNIHMGQAFLQWPDESSLIQTLQPGEFSKLWVDCLSSIRENPHIKVLCLNGLTGTWFSSGSIERLQVDYQDASAETVLSWSVTFQEVIRHLREMQIMVVSTVHGCVGGAILGIMLASDLVLAQENTIFKSAYTDLGTSPEGGLTYALPRAIGSKRAMEFLLSEIPLTAEKALAWGLVNAVLHPDDLHRVREQYINHLLSLPRWTLDRIKQLLNQSWTNELPEQLGLEAEHFAASTVTEDFKNRLSLGDEIIS